MILAKRELINIPYENSLFIDPDSMFMLLPFLWTKWSKSKELCLICKGSLEIIWLGQGKRQIYGSQIGRDQETGDFYVSPLIDPENVDKRRAEVGLGPLADYVGHWDMTWDIEKHKANTVKIEAAAKEKENK